MRRSTSSLLAACCVAPTLLTIFAGSASAAVNNFGSGNIVVEQVGANGATAVGSSSASAVFLDEFNDPTTTATLQQQIPLPTAASGSQLALTASGSATSEGQISDSLSGGLLLVPGYNTPVGTASVASTVPSGATNARVIAAVTSAGLVDTSTYNNANSGNNIRSATSNDSTFLSTGAVDGVQTQTFGSTASVAKSVKINARVSHLAGPAAAPTLFMDSSTATGTGATAVAAGLDAVDGTTGALTNLIPDANPYGFATARSGTGPTYLAPNGAGTTDSGIDTIYLGDATAGTGITKYVYNGTSFVASGAITGTGVYGLTTKNTPAGVEIFATSPSTLYKVVDNSGTGTLTGTLTAVATAPTNTAFRGVALAPTSNALPAGPAANLPEAPYAILLPLIGLSAVGVLYVRRTSRREARAQR